MCFYSFIFLVKMITTMTMVACIAYKVSIHSVFFNDVIPSSDECNEWTTHHHYADTICNDRRNKI